MLGIRGHKGPNERIDLSQLPLALTVGANVTALGMTIQKPQKDIEFGVDLDGKDMFMDSLLNFDT